VYRTWEVWYTYTQKVKIMKRKIFTLLCILMTVFSLSNAQDACAPRGWCTQNGGTTGGGSATPQTVTTLSALTTAANSSGSKVIYVSGTMGAGVSTRVKVTANTTIIGLPGAKLYGGFDVRGSNVIIRNMIVQGPGSVDVDGVDCINIDGTSTTNVWIDHCDIYDGQDGNLDITNGCNYITISWTKFHYTGASSNHQYCNLIGNSDSKTSDRGKLKVTMMYNWWTSGTVERMPRVRFGQVHVVNNLFDSPQTNYCVRAGVEADILVESNYFDAVNDPIDLYENNFTAVTARNNVFNSTTGNTSGSGTSFTPPYSLSIAAAANVKSLVTASCGAGATLPSPTQCGCGTSTSYTLTTTANPAAGGSITRSPNATTYTAGTVVTLTATPASGYTFTGWSGGASGTGSTTTVTMNANTSVTANFTSSTGTSYTLTTTASPGAGGTIMRSPNATTYSAGTVVTLTATPASGYTFSSWSGGASGTGATTTVTMNANVSVTANFNTSSGGTTLRIDDKSATGTGYCSANGSRQNTYTGADGGYYINLSNSGGQGITWAVRAGAAGTYNIRWRYANAGSQSATTARVLVNGVEVNGSVAFPKTAAWTTWTTTAQIPVTLVAGANKIRLETTAASEFANIDWIEITGTNPTEALCSAATGSRMATEAPVTQSGLQLTPTVLPNPTNGVSTLRFGVTAVEKVMVNLYSADGRLVKTITNRTYSPGNYTLPVEYTGLQKGVYFITINNGAKRTVLQNMFVR
jgi:uncharacterized repeat protein (TIGR02543 family)